MSAPIQINQFGTRNEAMQFEGAVHRDEIVMRTPDNQRWALYGGEFTALIILDEFGEQAPDMVRIDLRERSDKASCNRGFIRYSHFAKETLRPHSATIVAPEQIVEGDACYLVRQCEVHTNAFTTINLPTSDGAWLATPRATRAPLDRPHIVTGTDI